MFIIMFLNCIGCINNILLINIYVYVLLLISDDLVIQSRENCQNGLSIVSLNCQSLPAKFDYIRLLIDKFANNNCALQVLCLQESWFSSETFTRSASPSAELDLKPKSIRKRPGPQTILKSINNRNKPYKKFK